LKEREKKRGFLFPTRRSHVTHARRFSLSIIDDKKNFDDDDE